MSFIPNIQTTTKLDVLSSSTLLTNGSIFTGTTTTAINHPEILLVVETDQDGLYTVEVSQDGTNWVTIGSFNYRISGENIPHVLTVANRFVRVQFTNNSGVDQTYFRLATYAGLFSQASTSLKDVVSKDANTILTSPYDFSINVSRGLVEGHEIILRSGFNEDVDAGEDVWNSGGDYSGFDATADEQLEVFSGDAADVGVERSSGTATGGSHTTLELTGATFVADGVVVGDVVINDTKQTHGIVTNVTDTVLTVVGMQSENLIEEPVNENNDAFRVVGASGTGAAVVKLLNLIDTTYAKTSEYVVLNGVTAVATTGSYIRNDSAKVILAGTGGTNAGAITIRQDTTTANVMGVIAIGHGETHSTVGTVPEGKVLVVDKIAVSMFIASGANGSAQVALLVRERGQAWRSVLISDITEGFSYEYDKNLTIREHADYKLRVLSVEVVNTVVSASITGFEFDKK